MKNLRIISVLFVAVMLLGCNNRQTKSHVPDISKAQTAFYKEVFSNLKQHLRQDDGKLWGRPLYGPILLVDPQTRALVANEKDNKGLLLPKGGVYIGYLPKEINISNTALNWEGKRWTMVMLPLPQDQHARLNLLTHELFHRIQPVLGFTGMNNMAGNHLDELNARIYLKLELEALKKALTANNDIDRNKDLRDALLFRSYRDALYPGEKEEENALEINEGLAEYTGSILSGRTDHQLRVHYIDRIDQFYGNPTFVRSFAYVTIPVYGYFMKQENPGWNKEISVKTNLTDFMMKFFRVTVPEDLRDAVNSIKNNYGFDAISRFEISRDNEHKKRIAAYEVRFQKNPTLTLRFVKMNIRFDPRNIMPFKDIGTVYPNMRISDTWGILNVEKGALLSKNWDFVKVSKPNTITDSLVQGEGWKLTLNPGWEVVQSGENYLLKQK